MKVDVLLINPGSRAGQYQALSDEYSAIEPPSLAALFATYLPPLPTDTLKGGEVLNFRDTVFQLYYRNDDYLRMIERKFGRAVVEHIERMVAIPLPRKLLEE